MSAEKEWIVILRQTEKVEVVVSAKTMEEAMRKAELGDYVDSRSLETVDSIAYSAEENS